MIGVLRGQIWTEGSPQIIMVSDIGYEVYCMEEQKVGKGVVLYTYLEIKENIMRLYGFERQYELDFFKILIKVKGLGCITALKIMRQETVHTLKEAIKDKDTKFLSSFKGVGKTTVNNILKLKL